MASSVHRYLDFLEQRVPIAPANTQEELQAAQTIAGVMQEHDLEVGIEEFDVSSAAPLMRGILRVALLVGILVAGMGVLVLTIVFGLVAIAAAAILVLDFLGNDLLTRYSPPARSQNVVACHRASGPLVSKGNRPIVIVAHYDTPRENLLFNPAISRFAPIVRIAAAACVPVVGVCALVQLFGAGSVFGRVLWVLGIVAALPAAAVGVAAIAERFMPCTAGSNDNKSSVAALLSILNIVRPNDHDLGEGFVPSPEAPGDGDAVDAEGLAEDGPAEEAGPEGAPVDDVEYVEEVVGYRYEEVVGVRHGKEVVEGLGMLPETCELEYLDPQPVEEIVRKVPVRRPEPVPEAQDAADGAEAATTVTNLSPVDDMAEGETGDETVSMDAADIDAAADADGEPPMSGDGDDSGLEPDPDATVAAPPVDDAPAAPDDPEWGKSTFKPKVVSFGRRASLFDLPDPSVAESDPLSSPEPAPATPAGGETVAMPAEDIASSLADEPSPAVSAEADEPAVDGRQDDIPEMQQLSSDPMAEPGPAAKGRRKAHRLFGRKRKQEQESMSEWLGIEDDFDAKRDGRAIGSWENLEHEENEGRQGRPRRGGRWKGGAAPSSKFRLIDGGEPVQDAPTDEDLREAILGMGDDELIAHDIWFVALGASALDHAGMKAFLAEHRTSCRGSFLVNLDSIGAGRLSILAQEGIHNRRRADRRLARLLGETADDLHIELDKIPSCPAGTDATPAMQSSLRSITIMGSDDGANPALSHTPADLPEEIDERQVSAVADLVCEVIRRS